jgi:hypothetical protein
MSREVDPLRRRLTEALTDETSSARTRAGAMSSSSQLRTSYKPERSLALNAESGSAGWLNTTAPPPDYFGYAATACIMTDNTHVVVLRGSGRDMGPFRRRPPLESASASSSWRMRLESFAKSFLCMIVVEPGFNASDLLVDPQNADALFAHRVCREYARDRASPEFIDVSHLLWSFLIARSVSDIPHQVPLRCDEGAQDRAPAFPGVCRS